MAGFENDIGFAKNFDFTQSDNQAPTESNGLATNGQMWIGSTAVNAGGTHVNVGALTSPNNTITIGYASPNITLDLAGGGIGIDSLTPNSGTSPVVPNASGNVTLQGAGSITTIGGLNSESIELTGLTNHAVLVGAGTSTITKIGPVASTGAVLQSNGLGSDPGFSTATYPSIAGTTGNVMTSDGTNFVSSAPTQFNTVTAQRITATGAFTYTPTAGMKYVIVELVGGSGGSGGVAATSGSIAISQSTGSGGYAKFILTAAQVGASLTGSVGTAGGAGSAGNNAGTAGGNTTLATTSPWTCAGSAGGAGGASTAGLTSSGGAGGAVTTGTGTIIYTTTGATAGDGTGGASAVAFSGTGGSNPLGQGGRSRGLSTVNNVFTGAVGFGFGAGSSGTVAFGTNAAGAGAAGSPGVAIFTEFLNV